MGDKFSWGKQRSYCRMIIHFEKYWKCSGPLCSFVGRQLNGNLVSIKRVGKGGINTLRRFKKLTFRAFALALRQNQLNRSNLSNSRRSFADQWVCFWQLKSIHCVLSPSGNIKYKAITDERDLQILTFSLPQMQSRLQSSVSTGVEHDLKCWETELNENCACV